MTDTLTEPRVGFAVRPLADFVGESLPEPRWAVEGIWPEGAMGVIAGRPKDKKSTHAAELAVSLNTGTPMFGLKDVFPSKTRPVPVLYVQQENANTRVQRDLQLILTARGLGELREETVLVSEDEDATYQAFDYTPALEGWAERMPRFDIVSNAGFDLNETDHREWLVEQVTLHGYRYVFLDPLYQLIGMVDEKDSAQLRPILRFLLELKNTHRCAAIITHHMSDKGGKNEASSMLGSTYIHAWYENAIFTRSTDQHIVTLKVDAQREVGTVREHVLMGLGVGRWMHTPQAEGQQDALGREAPQVASKEARKARLRALLAEPESAGWSDERLGEALNVGAKTISRYRSELDKQDS